MVKPAVPVVPADHKNNPSKEIIAGSGIYSQIAYGVAVGGKYYAADLPNSLVPNSGVFITTTSTSTTQPPGNSHALYFSKLSNTSMHIIDDMNVINNYIHYVPAGQPPGLKTFDPRSFLAQSIVNFNIYSIAYR